MTSDSTNPANPNPANPNPANPNPAKSNPANPGEDDSDGNDLNEVELHGDDSGIVVEAPREVLVCISPKAGSGAGRAAIPRLRELVESAGMSFITTESIEALRERLRPDRRERDATGNLAVVAAGGDGTLALVAGFASAEIPIVPMPLGTENLVARYFGCSASAEDVFETLTRGHDLRLDAGRADGRLFLVMATAGFDADVVRATHLRRRGHIDRFAYFGPIVRSIRRYRFPEITMRWDSDSGDVRHGIERACWGMVFNLPRYGGGLTIEPGAVGDDGELDMISFRRGSVGSGLRYVWGIVTGRHLRDPDVTRRRVGRVVWESGARVPYQLDGDYAGHLPVTIECLPARVRLRLPPGARSPKMTE